MVSGALALVLTSCPELTWRDVKWLLSYKSKKIDLEDKNWVENSAGRNHNINYGYGLIDTNNMIKECRSPYYTLLPKEISAEVKKSNINLHIPDYDKPKYIYIDFKEEFNLEWVELTIDSNHPYAGDYEINLVSPKGTKTQIITPNELRSDYYKGGFRFSSAAFTGENTKGIWKVEFIDKLELDSGTITSVNLKIYGHKKD
jgi:kexin